MKVYCITHVEFEKPGAIREFFEDRGDVFYSVCLSCGDVLWDDVPDVLVVMGGPMGVHDDAVFPWLPDEKAYIRRCIDSGCRVIGVCLGAQLLALLLGGAVRASDKGREIGWFPVFVSPEGSHTPIGESLPVSFMAFHWHGDECVLPDGAVSLFYNHHTPVQGFLWDNRVLGLQFHLEADEGIISSLVENCEDEIAAGGVDVMSTDDIFAGFSYIAPSRRVLFSVLSDFMSL